MFYKTYKNCYFVESRAFVHLDFNLKEPTKHEEIEYTWSTLNVYCCHTDGREIVISAGFLLEAISRCKNVFKVKKSCNSNKGFLSHDVQAIFLLCKLVSKNVLNLNIKLNYSLDLC